MIAYFDTSAFVPLLIDEPASSFCRRLWDDADAIVTSRLLYVETAAALALGVRLGRLTDAEHTSALRLHNQLWREFDVVEADEDVINRAADLAYELALRGYDAVHTASAKQVNAEDLVVASGDRKLLEGCAKLGMATADTVSPA
ncbi:type II toxin-antitoxin system VapC family toxin [Saccharomonospora sp. NPDC046836]|uniref:type II toxin-antitoxin system VapC family toxin n=1 Tax=Saccharomonospora sp. NPDC046836 TaxID=3156921 RepID=UPI0033C76570